MHPIFAVSINEILTKHPMNLTGLKQIIAALGNILVVLGAAMLLPALYGLVYDEGTTMAFLQAAVISLGIGIVCKADPFEEREFGTSEGFIIVSMAWIVCSFFGCLPFLFADITPSFIDAYFEAMSGFTTTGSTVFSGLDNMPKSIILWRAMTQWIGGMGIVVLMLAIFPMLGSAAFQIYKAEVPGPTSERIRPKIKDSAKILWIVYAAFTFSEFGLLAFTTPMPWIDALCISFSTLSTGGFAPHDASIAHWDSLYIEMILCFFMFCGGVNFMLHYHVMRGKLKPLLSNFEFKTYAVVTFTATILIAISLTFSPNATAQNFSEGFRHSIFQVISIITTTGFGTNDFNLWPAFGKLMILILMLNGACAGSTAGGIKIIRYIISLKGMMIEIQRTVFPSMIKVVKLANAPIEKGIINNIVYFFFLYCLMFLSATLALTLCDVDLMTSATATISCLSNIGPGLNEVGPATTYASLPAMAKIILSFVMMIGRLEIYSVLVLIFPSTWKN